MAGLAAAIRNWQPITIHFAETFSTRRPFPSVQGHNGGRTMKKSLFLGGLILALLFTAGTASASDRWLHVRVQEDGPDGERVSVNIPIQLVEAILPTIETDEMSGGMIHLHDADMEGIDLRELLKALQDAPDAEFVTVEGRDESVRVAKENDFIVVKAEEDDGEKVRVTMPLDVVDAMLGGDSDKLDLVAALDALASYDGGDLVTVESEDSHIRIWIDSSESGK
jgi:hypothetical protein